MLDGRLPAHLVPDDSSPGGGLIARLSVEFGSCKGALTVRGDLVNCGTLVTTRGNHRTASGGPCIARLRVH